MSQRSSDEYMLLEPRAWLTDGAVSRCGLAAQGLWVRMVCVMWKEPVCGVLPGDVVVLARLTGVGAAEFLPLFEELEANGVFSRGAELSDELAPDAVVNRRMWRKGVIHSAKVKAGRMGGFAKGRRNLAKEDG